nr:hypothetical protein [Mesobacillus foraminis]
MSKLIRTLIRLAPIIYPIVRKMMAKRGTKATYPQR